MIYNIAGIIVEMDVKYEPLLSQAKAYEVSEYEKVDVALTPTEEAFANFREKYPHFSVGDAEYVLYGSRFYTYLVVRNGILLHSSCVVYNGYSYLFSANSGTGKSTHTQLWLKRFEGAKILNDDKPAVLIEEDGIYAYGTPFSGKTDLNLNEKYPIKGIIFLNRGETNSIDFMDSKEAIYNILSQTIRPLQMAHMDKVLECIDKIVSEVPIYKFYCNISLEAVDTVYNFLNGDKNGK